MELTRTNQKTRLLQFRIRDILGLVIVVACVVSFVIERTRREQLEQQSKSLTPAPLIWVWSPGVSAKYSTTANVAVAGIVFIPKEHGDLKNPRVKLALVRAADSKVIQSSQVSVIQNESQKKLGRLQFIDNMKPVLVPGVYVLRADCFDGSMHVASGVTMFEGVKPAAKTQPVKKGS